MSVLMYVTKISIQTSGIECFHRAVGIKMSSTLADLGLCVLYILFGLSTHFAPKPNTIIRTEMMLI